MTRVGLASIVAVFLAVPALAATPEELARKLRDPKAADAALDELVALGKVAVPSLQGEAIEGKDLAARGWAIAGLGEIGGEAAAKTLLDLQDKGSPELVQAWAAAARIKAIPDLDSLVKMIDLLQRFPATDRPFKEKLKALVVKDGGTSAESLLRMTTDGRLAPVVTDAVLALGMPRLIDVLTHGKDMTARQQAAAYLGVLAQQQGAAANEIVGGAVIKAYAFDPSMKDVPWAGGPLYVPGLSWDAPHAQRVTGALVAWDVWCQRKGRDEERRKIAINLQALAGFAGYQPDWQPTSDWIRIWSARMGRDKGLEILKAQGLEKDPAWLAKLPAK